MNTKITLKKRILSVLLTLILVLSMVPLSAFAAGNAAAVTAGGKTTEFATYDLAVAYANQQESCTLKLLENIVSPQYEDTDSIPFITGNVTLDLNGKEIDAVDVGAVSYDEETDETVKGASGTLTVTGDGSVDYLTVNHGTLTLNGGTVEELSANSFAAAVGITGGTVKKLSLSSSGDEKITAAVSGGSVQVLNLDDAAVSFTGGNHGLKTGNWAINSGTLNISGGSYSTLNFLVVGGNICLSGGEFGYISTDPKMASSEYKKPILGSILGDNCAFYGTDGSIVNADALTLENVRIITNHEHTYKDGKCTTCGASCNHKGKVNYSDGVCETCGTQLEAEVKYENGTSSYFDSFISAIDSVPHGMKDAVTVYLLKDFYRIDDDLYLANNNKINLNLNAKVLSGNGKIIVANDNSLTLTGGDIDKSLTVEAAGGDVTIEDTCGDIGNISVTSADSAVSIKGGSAEKLSLAFTDTKSLKNVKLSGGKFKYISFNGSGTVAVTDMLEAGYAFKDNKGTLSGKAGSLMPYGVLWPANTYFAEFEVVKCDHGEANDRLGSCNFCGKIYKAKITDKNGAVRYTDELQETDLADGNTVVLFSDISDRIIPKGDCTIDLNGHSVRLISFIVQDGTLTLKGYGTVTSFILGYQDIASTLAIEPTTSSDKTITIKNLSVNNTTDTKLTCGTFNYIEVKKAYFSVNDLLADGYSFYNETWGQLYYAGNVTSISGPYHIEKHDHTFTAGTDGEFKCGCGLRCYHDTIGDDGKCTDMCKQQIYVAALTKSDGSKTRYKTFADAWSAAIENNGSVLKLLCDVDFGQTGSKAALNASSGTFTVDLNRFTLSADSSKSVISVGNTAKLTVKNGCLTNTTTKGDSSKSCAVTVSNGYVELENVELTGGSAFGEQNCSAIVYNGTLNITDSTFNGALMVYPDSLGKAEPKITSATLNNGFLYKYEGYSNKDYDGLKGFFADGSMFFDENGKYVDLTYDAYWSTETIGTGVYTTFEYAQKAVVKPHTHTFTDGVCSECGYTCPHNGGIEREAGYFRKAVCSLCRCEYGDYVNDITAPVGEINTKERTWWQTALNKISFGLFYKEDVKAEIIGKDDSYNQPGFDITKHAVKIEYLVSNAVLSEEAVKTSSFTEYTEEIDLSDDNRYVIYAKLTDHAGNVTYAGSDGFEIDKTAPVIEGMVNGGQYKFCIEKTVTVTEKNTDKVMLDGAEITLDENGGFSLPVDSKEHTVFVEDKAGNQTTVYVTVYSSHSFDAATESCKQCGTHAAAKAENGDITEFFSNGDELFEALNDQKYSGAIATLLEDVTLTKSVNLQNNLTVNLNGKTLRKKGSTEITVNSGNVMFSSQQGEGIITVPLTVDGSDAHLIMGSGLGNVSNVRRTAGKLTVYSGNYSMFSSYADSEAENITLYGGKYLSISLKSALCRDILAQGYRYKGYSYEQAAVGSFPDVVVVIPCDHADIVDNTCSGCGMEFCLSVEVNGTEKIFDTFESAVRCAEQNEGCTVKLLRDLTLDKTTAGSLMYGYHIDLRAGKYTIDLAGQILDVDGNYLSVDDNCNLTICDSVGGGMLADSKGNGLFKVSNAGKLTIMSGDFTDINIQVWNQNALTLKGGSFKEINSAYSAYCSPFAYLADGYAFALSDGSRYANEGDVKINNDQVIRNVTVVSAPVVIPTLGQPNDITFYLTSPNNMKYAGISASYAGGKTDKNITVTLEKTDGTVIKTEEVPTAASIVKSFDLTGFTTENSGQYRVKLEFNGYVLYSNAFTVTVMECEHPGYDEDTHKCTQCGCDLAVAVINGEKTTGYVDFAEALAAAQSDENKNCTLKLLSDVSGTVAVKSGTFTIDAANVVIDGKLNVSKGADLTVSGGVVTGNVICAKGGKLTASKTYFSGTVNCVGDGDFKNCQFIGTVSGKSGLKLDSCEITGDISVSGNAEWQMCIVGGAVTVNNGGSLKSSGDTYRKAINVKSGGTLEIISGICNGVVTAESGSKFISASGSFSDVAVEDGVDFTLAGGKFTKITVAGKHLIDCLKDGTAFEDTNTGDVIDGRVSIAGHVKVVSHTHSCVWNTKTHEKLCGCGYVETTDTKAPVISGIENGKTYYGATEFSVTDDNDFTVTIDGNPVKLTIGSYILVPDNKSHTITAEDAAGNTASVTVSTFMLYKVTLGSGNGYTVTGEPVAGYGTDYSFTVEIADGYSKTDNFMVDVNGMPLTSDNGSYTYPSVESDIYVTVFGVADITPPDAEVSVGTNKFKSFINNVSFGLFFKKSQTVSVTASDSGNGIDKIDYLLSDTAFTDKAAVSGDWTELTLTDGKASFSIEPNKKAYIYVRVTDVSGNVQIINTDGVVVYTDSQAITESVSFTMLEKNDVSFNVKLNGNTVSALYNGTALIGKDNYTVTEDGTVTLKNGYLSSLAAGEYTVRVAYNPMGESYKSGDEPNVTALKLTVNKAEPILDISDVVCQKEYDGQPIETPSYTTSSDGAVTVEYKPWGADDSACGTTAPKNVGKYEFRISVAESDTYKPTSAVGVCEILVKEVSIVGTAVKATKIYDGTDKAEITNMGSLSDNYDGKNLSIVVGEAAYSDKNVGEGKNVNFSGFALTGSAAANYKLVKQPASVIADITAKEITINGTTVEPSKVYDGTTAAEITNAGTLSDNYDGENLAIVTGSASYDNKNAGENKTVTFGEFSLTGSAAANYKLIKQPASVTADITVKEITINGTAVKPSKVYDGTTAAEITAVGAPSVNYDGDNLTVSVGKAEYDNKNAGTGKTVVFSGFSLSGSEASNYKLSAQPESVTADIAAKKITITGTSVKDSKVYDGNTDAEITSVGTIEGLIKGDKLTVKKGSAAYSDRNAGIGKTVTFSGFSVSGSAAANYELASQPESTFASIGAKELTVIDLKVKDKQYDGTNTAEIDGTPKLSGLVDGDSVQLLNGIPTFDDVNVGKNIPVSFTSFSLFGDSTMLCNYKLIQPSGITASITRYVADGSEYRVNSNDWINTDFVITANEGWLLSRTDTADGDWSNELTASDETKDGKLIFYVKNIKTGAISSAVTEKYHIDKTLPTGEIKLNGRSAFQTVLNKISFGLFFKDDVNVGVTAKDDSSGVKSVMYYESGSVLSEDEVLAITDWTEKSDFDIEASDNDKFVVYVRIEDNAGNVRFIGSDGAIFDTESPKIVGVENGKTYYVTKKVAVDDENLESVTLNGTPASEVFTLGGDTDATYNICAKDKAGNVTEYTVFMKPISSVTDAVSGITKDNVKSSDADTVLAVERLIFDIAESFDDGVSTDAEWNKLTKASAKCKELSKRIADVADEIARLTDGVNSYDINTVTSDDKTDIEKLIADIDVLLGGDNLTPAERDSLEALKALAKSLSERIEAAKSAAESPEITAVKGITKDNAKLEDKNALTKAKKAIEDALKTFGNNYTEEERKELEKQLDTVNEALEAIGNAEKVKDEIDKLPSPDNITPDDKDAVDRVREAADNLSEEEKAILGKEELSKIDALYLRISELEKQAAAADDTLPTSPRTGETDNIAMWMALLFVSGGLLTGMAVSDEKKKKHSEK